MFRRGGRARVRERTRCRAARGQPADAGSTNAICVDLLIDPPYNQSARRLPRATRVRSPGRTEATLSRSTSPCLAERTLNPVASDARSLLPDDLYSVDSLSVRYARVLLSRRLLRAFAVATVSGVFMLALAAAVIPIVLVTTQPRPAGAPARVALAALLMFAVSALAMGIAFLYLRALAALATGSRRVARAVIAIVGVWLAVVAFQDIAAFLSPYSEQPFHVLGLGAALIHTATALALAIGPFELWRADGFTRAVFSEPRFGSGWIASLGRLLDLPDVTAFRRARRIRAWLLIGVALLLEGAGFYTLVKWAERLVDAANKQLANPPNQAVFEPVLVILLVPVLAMSFGLIRLCLLGARRLRFAARKITVQSAADIVSADRRPPVLFLRSFKEEQVPLRGARMPWLLRAFDPGVEYRTLEEMIVHGLTYAGPVVAVADPSSRDSLVGAARWRLGEDDWQRFVESQIRNAGIAVIGVAATSGVRWELAALKASPGGLAKTIFVCPPGTTQDQALLAHLADVLGCTHATGDPFGSLGTDVHVLAATLTQGGAAIFYLATAPTELS